METSIIIQLKTIVLLLTAIISNYQAILGDTTPIYPSESRAVETQMIWKNMDWYTRREGQAPPAANYWKPENAYIDASGALHLKITKGADGTWYCAEWGSNEMFGYGDIVFTVQSPLLLDKNVVLSGYKYLDDQNELDIEVTRWGDVSAIGNAGFTVQPAPYIDTENHLRFDVSENMVNTVHTIHHYLSDISFEISKQDGTTLKSWQATPDLYPEEKAYFVFNLWLVDAQPPSDGKPVEIIISDFKFIPMNAGDDSNTDIGKAVLDLRTELASQKKLTKIRTIVNGQGTLASKINQVKVII